LRLERLRKECTDTGVRNQIGAWIEAEKKKLASDPIEGSQIEGK
jgi:hypothetical protein